ncbi:thaumatin family protein [Streptomyces sp. NPDC052101]|uniref:thaumatin family protein n=1 Tax=Streptomyces sp. NPDC052101 TaxID=3155763 RepID=UPI00341549FE
MPGTPPRIPLRPPLRPSLPTLLTALVAAVVAALLVLTPSTGASAIGPRSAAPAAAAAVNHTVTFVNNTGKKIWIGSAVNADGSKNFTRLPVLGPGQSATVTIPETADPGHWRGKFFARMGCVGTPGSTFHCAVGDCGKFDDHCAKDTGEQPTSLAEFNFDSRDAVAPWYDVSYVNAFSVPVTIAPRNASPGGGGCDTVGCANNLLPNCPAANLTRWPDGTPMLCTNPDRDVKTAYSDMIASHCPKAYGWSRQDQEPGNKVMQQCSKCSGFTVTFHRAS